VRISFKHRSDGSLDTVEFEGSAEAIQAASTATPARRIDMLVWIEEFLAVLAYSKRTQLAILLGVASFVSILTAAEYFVGRVNFHGALAPLTNVAREALLGRYEKAAWASLGAFMLLAIKGYRKDRKKFLS
jgi:hypothetical protein